MSDDGDQREIVHAPYPAPDAIAMAAVYLRKYLGSCKYLRTSVLADVLRHAL